MGLKRSGWSTIACVAFLFAVNAAICSRLFHTEFTNQVASIESAFISFSRWMMDHWHDRTWMPLWIDGIPARQVYGPMLHTSVAWLALQTGWTPQHAFHFLTASTYCLGPVALFWLIDRVTLRRGAALLAGLLYSLISPSTWVFAAIRGDAGGVLAARRFQTLARYGEGPHVTDLMMIPLALWMIEEAASAKRWQFLFLAPVTLAVLVLTNWTGTTGFAMALVAYVLMKWGASKYGERRLHWPTFIGVGVIAYMLASPWAPPSLIQTMQIASAKLIVQPTLREKLWVAIPFALSLLALHAVLRRFRVDPWVRFFAYFAWISGGIVTCDLVLLRPLIPIGHRFHVEFEMALLSLAALIATKYGARLPRNAQYAVIAILLVAGAWQARNYRRYAKAYTEPIDFTKTEEYKMAKWIGANLQGQRIFAPGSTSQWMNLFSDVPQMIGCCDQSVLAEEFRMAGYVIYTGDGTGWREAELSTQWLQLYGVSAVAVQESGTSQLGQPYVHPKKFDGHLAELWRDGESVIYRVPTSGSIAHVVSRTAFPWRHPVNGVDTEPLLPLLAAIEPASANASLKWISQHELEIESDMKQDDVIYLQQTYDAGWHAYVGSQELYVRPDVLGLTTIGPAGEGHHKIQMVYSGGLEDRIANAAHWIGAALLLVWTYRRAMR